MFVVKNMLKPHGELTIFDPAPQRSLGQTSQRVRKTMCCQHCGHQQILPENGEIADVGDLCRSCWQFICPACVKLGTCNPIEKQFAEAEKAGTFNPYRL